MQIQTHILFKDFLLLQYWLVYKRMAFIFITICGLAMLYFPVQYLLDTKQGNFPIIQLLFALLILIGLPFGIYRTARKQFKNNSNLSEQIEYEFTPYEITIKGTTFISELKWDKVYAIQKTAKWILIYQEANAVNVIPKRCFNKVEWNEFLDIVRSKPSLKTNLK